MRITLYLTSLLLLVSHAGPLTGAEMPVRTYRADMNEAAWRSEPGERACHLFHRVPGYGTALFSTSLDDQLAMTLFTRRPPEHGGAATVMARAPWWGDGEDRVIGETSVYPDRAVLKFGHAMTARILAELESGQAVVFRFESHINGSRVEIVLQPVNFRPAYEEHLRCLPRVNTGLAAGGRDDGRGASSPGAIPGGMAPSAMNASVPDVSTGRKARAQAAGDTPGGTPVAAGMADRAAAGRPATDSGASAQPTGWPERATDRSADRRDTTSAGAVSPRPAPEGIPLPPATNIHFVHDSARLDREDLDKIDALARQIGGNPHWSAVLLTGHTDSRGENHYNRLLGLGRARAVRERLIRKGVEPEKIRIQTAGENDPVGANDSVYGRAENRRVAVKPLL